MPSTRRGATRKRATCRSPTCCRCCNRSSLESARSYPPRRPAAWRVGRRAAIRAARRLGARTAVAAGLGARGGLAEMAALLEKRIPDRKQRLELMRTVHYEATRAWLDPQLVLGVIEVESAFRKYAVSRAGARGYMQVMPFWVKQIGQQGHTPFHLRTNLIYGCWIPR